jgi:sugar-specific transcriptional regulator TrmB
MVSNFEFGGSTLEVPEKHLETLVHLGLTSCQAKVYLAAIQSGTTTAKNISQVTKIARP